MLKLHPARSCSACAQIMVPAHHAVYTPQQNDVVERRNQTAMEIARSMMKAKNLSGYFWGEAVTTVVYLLNRSPTRSVKG
jgi:hypothetical protein